MDIRRSKPPESVERALEVQISREEVQQILTAYIKKKMNSERLVLDGIAVIGSADGKMEAITLSGVEIIPLTWTDKATEAITPK